MFLFYSNHREDSKDLSKKRGFTLAELMISITILGILIATAAAVYGNFFASVRNIKAANTVYDEARFLVERIVKEVRNGTIDYEEYYNQNLRKDMLGDSYELVRNETYAQDYCQYSLKFYTPGKDEEIGTADDESTGELAEGALPAIGKLDEDGTAYIPDPIQNNLYLININGNQRTYIKRIVKEINGVQIGKAGILRLVGKDYGIDHINAFDPVSTGCVPDAGENDGRIDTWLCDEGFTCEPITTTSGLCTGISGDVIVSDPAVPDNNSFLDITPPSLDVVDIKFIVAPMDDPRKAYNTDEIQIQPHVTIKIIARANPSLAAEFQSGKAPDIVLESTISARAYNEILTECNLKQCTDFSEPKACPLTAGVCSNSSDEPLTQACTNYLWPGCTAEEYKQYVIDSWGTDLFEDGSEFASCADDDNTCKTDRCIDTYDNDCDGLTDISDPDCKYYLCNNGTLEAGEQCIDVGGACEQIRHYEESGEITCTDNYDNDCDEYADEFDPECIQRFCANGTKDPEDPERFLGLDYDNKQYLFKADDGDYSPAMSETCIDIGGICDLCLTSDGLTSCVCGDTGCTTTKIATTSNSGAETGTLCFDGLDNDCDTFADEFDPGCQEAICTNNDRDCDLAHDDWSTKDYLVGFIDTDVPLCRWPDFPTGNEETCVDVGGLCDDLRIVKDVGGGIFKYFDHTLIANENVPVLVFPTTPPENTCTDDLDNDCDGLIDWEDIDCCPDGDGDDFPDGNLDTCQPPVGVETDCADDDPLINPDADEICDGVADNDCDGLSDSNPLEADCCTDNDGDGYGIEAAYTSCDIPTAPDCDDFTIAIHPGQLETECMNEEDGEAINDDCDTAEIDDPASPGDKITVQMANHIDWYYDQPGGLALAFTNHLYDSDCCTGSTELCDDNTYGDHGSDENCNGKEGEADNYCMDSDGLRFFDNFTSASYLAGFDPAIKHDKTSGDISLNLPTDVNAIVSSSFLAPLDIASECAGSDYKVFFSPAPSNSIPAGTTLRFQLSGDNGITWCGDDDCIGLAGDWITMDEITDAVPASVNFSSPAYQLRWRAELSGDGDDDVPVLSDISLVFQCL